jgi:hypothetical protein
MSYFTTAADIDEKLGDLLFEHNLMHEFKTARHPIVLEVFPDASPAGQMEMFANADGPVSSCDARLRLVFAIDGKIEIRTDNRIVLSDTLLNKIKGLGKKYLAAYTYGFFAERRNREEFSAKEENKSEE